VRTITAFAVVAFFAACASAPIALRDMGSFHVGGRDVKITGKPVREVVFTPGGVPAKVDLNGTYSVEAMYVQYFLPANRRGAVPLHRKRRHAASDHSVSIKKFFPAAIALGASDSSLSLTPVSLRRRASLMR